MGYQHLIDLDDYSFEDLNEILQLAGKIRKDPRDFFGRMQGRILATLFYEPSTRTQISFQTAMLKLGGQIVGFDNPQNSSVSKGENLKDTIRIISGYADIIAIRHPFEGAAKAASLFAECPVINAGDGGHLHPTQTLTDLVTLTYELGRLDHMTVGLCGDLKFGRTVHSLIKTLVKFPGNRFILISTPQLTVPAYIKKIIHDSNCEYEEISSLRDAIPLLDVLYMTRIQRERFATMAEYDAQKDVYRLDTDKLNYAKENLKILHPLPRVDEIDIAVDDDPRALYYKQAKYGVYARMALILKALSKSGPDARLAGTAQPDVHCHNPRCITQTEAYLKNTFLESGEGYVCEYCEH